MNRILEVISTPLGLFIGVLHSLNCFLGFLFECGSSKVGQIALASLLVLLLSKEIAVYYNLWTLAIIVGLSLVLIHD